MQGFNRVTLIGNMTRDPQLSYTPGNTEVCEFGLAVNRKWKDAAGNQQEDVLFIDVACYARLADAVAKYARKGSPVHIDGRLRLAQWDDKNGGGRRSKISVIAASVIFLGANPNAGGNGQSNQPADQTPADLDPETPF